MRRFIDEPRAFLAAALINPVERVRTETPAMRRRRRIVVGLTVAVGAVALGLALNIAPGAPEFYAATLGVAALWIVGAFASGPLYLGEGRTRDGGRSRGVLQGFLLGLILLAIFAGGALVVVRIPLLAAPVEDLLDHARLGTLWLVALITAVNGVAEELFFRGAVYASLDRRFNAIGSTALYAASTLFTGVPLLTFAAVCLGTLTAAQRRVTGGVLGPITSHLTWSLGMLFLLPPILSLGG
ncbi:MAG TPA: CPBP family glutamic-type intramembrane protease [Arachnia sp.]|nr:CPBP family glutamic-type intramembrane protease [Arachnia sp.]